MSHTNINIRIKGRNKQEIAETEARIVQELDSFRTEKYMYFLFINALWMIITTVLLLYTGIITTRLNV